MTVTSISQIVDRIDTVSRSSANGHQTVSDGYANSTKRKNMANVSTILSGEAGIHTVKGGQEIELRLPTLEEGQEYPPLMKFLAACMFRAEEELGWWEDQARWYDAFTKDKAFTKTRAQIRLVK